MKGMQKKACAIVAVCAAVVSMGACGGSSGGSSSNHLSIMWWGNQVRNDRTAQVNTMFEQQHEGVTIDGQFASMDDMFKKLSTQAASRSMPDIIQMNYNYYSQYINNGTLIDLQQYIDDGTIDVSNIDKDVLAQGEVNGKQYGISTALGVPVLAYDKNITDKAGVTIPDNMTIEQFEEISKTIYEKTGWKTNYAYMPSLNFIAYAMRGQGKHLFNDDGTLGVDAADVQSWFDVYEKGIREGWHISPEVFGGLQIGQAEQDPLVYGTDPSQRSWCMFAWGSTFNALRKAAQSDQNLQMTSWPAEDTKLANYTSPSQLWVVSRDCKNPKLAAEWINFYLNNEDANKVLLLERGITVNNKILEELTPSLSDTDKAVVDFTQNVVKPNSSKVDAPFPSASYQMANQILFTLEESVMYGKISAAEAAQQFVTQSQEAIAKSK